MTRPLHSSRPALRGAAVGVALLAGVALTGAAAADDDAPERFAVHGQATYVEQETSGFAAPYRGPNSLTPDAGRETADATLYVGARVWPGAEAWLNVELDQGFGLDNTLGLAAFPSGEAYKLGKKQPYLRLPRLFVRQTVDLSGERENVTPIANQLGGSRNVNRWVFTVGKMSVTDIFDLNQYAHDPRSDFLNWAALDAGTFDYAADSWGYTVGAAAEWYEGAWALRAGFFDLSDVPNSPRLEPGFDEFQVDLELERRFILRGRHGKLLLTVFDSHGRIGLLDAALALARETGAPVDIAAVRSYRSRIGADLSLEQQIAQDWGVFARYGKASGNTEIYEFADIDRALSFGVSVQGLRWGRPDDTVGLAALIDAISAERAQYLNAGGLGILIGDGRLPHPGAEQGLETYYTLAVLHGCHVTLDYQFFENPAYNRDRGPVSVFALRVHGQF
jgi:high affinity Mn2+ porin